MSTEPHSVDLDSIIIKERERIDSHREKRKDTSREYIGLAISGGGIRSASFGLGVLQALALSKYNILKKLDYLSTVSGGGYIGSSLTWLNHNNDEPWEFPLGKRGMGARTEEDTESKDKDSKPNRTALDFIRQHGNYLTPGLNLSAISLFATVLRNTVLSFAVYFSILVFFVYIAVHKLHFIAKPFTLVKEAPFPWEKVSSITLCGALIFIGLFLLVAALYGIGTFFVKGNRPLDYFLRVNLQKIFGWIVTFAGALALLASLPLAFAVLQGATGTVAVGTAAAAGAGGGIYEFIKQRSVSTFKSAPAALRIWITAFLLIYGLLLLAYVVAGNTLSGWTMYKVGLCFLLPGLGFGYFINTNFFGVGRMYRDRLMETFLPNAQAIADGSWSLATEADRAELRNMCGEEGPGPYHLINCNVVMVDSKEAKFRGRGGDSFLFSPLFCGSDASCWRTTESFCKDMTLATAMAISGAAANPNSGVGGKGPTRNRLVSFLMAFLSLRLGYWVSNPSAEGYQAFMAKITQPNLIYPGIVQGLLGQRLNAKAGYLELSDGGHFENTGLYELARRKLDVIIISDAGADPDFTMSDLGNAIERIRVDFGYYIRFPEPGYDLANLMPGSTEQDGTFFDKKYGLAKSGFAVGKIVYGEKEEGIIIYIKSTLVSGLPGDIYAYKKGHEKFPHQTTGDQFFDEVQLEAYRELGYQLCKSMLMTNAGRENSWV